MTIENLAYGLEEPTPTLPVFVITKCVVVAVWVEEAISKSLNFVSPLLACIESFANGEVEPMPILYVVSTVRAAEPLFVKNFSGSFEIVPNHPPVLET